MVFRAYEHFDPSNDKRITSADFIIDADILVVQVSDGFSTGIVMDSSLTVSEDSPVTLLMDVSDLQRRSFFGEALKGEKPKPNELDALDGVGGGMNPDERKELEQLERWKGNTPEVPAASTPSAPEIPPPAPEVPPPAPQASPAPMEEIPPPASPSAPEAPTSQESQDLDRLLDQ
jgi:hypothetical protein